MKRTMIKIHLYIIIFFTSILNVFSQDVNNDHKNQFSEFCDGPYIFIEKNKLIQKEIINGKVFTKILKTNSYDTIFAPNKDVYTNVKKIAALSDIHGKYELAIEILKNNKIIDQKLNWKFGKGHLVIVGDVFDRGDKVNEILLLIYKLENQAKDKGGRVHLLLGNHEYMVLHEDLRYVSEKYHQTSQLLNLNYNELYSNETVIGRWLRSKPTIIKLNNNVFVHGGVSKDFISSNNFDIESINNIMRASIERDKAEMKSSNFYDIYYGEKSLIWYRGYFYDNLMDKDISEILRLTDSEHIVVGHCSNEEVVSLFGNKIFGVDSSIKKGEYGEILFIRNNKYVRKTLGGEKKHFN
jgi:hypothetical protein